MDSAIPAGYSRLVRCLGESSPRKRDVLFGRQSPLRVGASSRKGHGISEFVTVSKELQNLGARSAESAMTGNVFRERRLRKDAHLIGNQQEAIKSWCPLERTPRE